MRQAMPQRHVRGGAVSTAGAEGGVEDAVPFRDVYGPTAEDVGDDARREAIGHVGYEAVEVGFEGVGGEHEVEDEGVGQGVGVFGVGGEAVLGGFEGEGSEMDGGVGGELGLEVVDVDGGADESYFVGGVSLGDEVG